MRYQKTSTLWKWIQQGNPTAIVLILLSDSYKKPAIGLKASQLKTRYGILLRDAVRISHYVAETKN